jgi:hypothetical protein
MPSLRDFLRGYREEIPSWLKSFGGLKRSELFHHFLGSRLVFYPGSGYDGGPVATFNSAHAAHCFVYVDYLISKAKAVAELESHVRGFHGYRSLARIDLTKNDLGSRDWVRHARREDGRPWVEPVSPFGLIEILEREQNFDDSHGAERFAILWMGCDGFAAFDALFCQNNHVPPPFCIVIQDHGFGGNYNKFGAGGLLERLAQRTNVFPEFLLVGDNTTPWENYCVCEKVGSAQMGQPRHQRSLYQLDSSYNATDRDAAT